MKKLSILIPVTLVALISACNSGGAGIPVEHADIAKAHFVGGSISGLAANQSITLLNNGSNPFTVSSNGTFSFTNALNKGSNYKVTISSQPAGATCTLSNASGGIVDQNITNVNISCKSKFLYFVGSEGYVQKCGFDNNGNVSSICSLEPVLGIATSITLQPVKNMAYIIFNYGECNSVIERCDINKDGDFINCNQTAQSMGRNLTVSNIAFAGGISFTNNDKAYIGVSQYNEKLKGNISFATPCDVDQTGNLNDCKLPHRTNIGAGQTLSTIALDNTRGLIYYSFDQFGLETSLMKSPNHKKFSNFNGDNVMQLIMNNSGAVAYVNTGVLESCAVNPNGEVQSANCTYVFGGSGNEISPMAMIANSSQTELYTADIKGNVHKCDISSTDGSLSNCNNIGNIGGYNVPLSIAISN